MTMRFYLQQNVFDAALDRIRRIFDEFPAVMVNMSGGKDSTVVFFLALQVARERNRLPLNVFWMDQEAEWQMVADYVRDIMYMPEVKPYWFQGPFLLSNATTNQEDNFLHCWRDGDTWLRPKDPVSIHENKTGEERFHKLFGAFAKTYFPDTPLAKLTGVRCEESPARAKGLTCFAKYKDITWGAAENPKLKHYTFHPLYDWSWRDIWTAIHKNRWPYCKIYDYMYMYGSPVNRMRVSNLHHEGALTQLGWLQEIEPLTWNKLLERLSSVNALSKLREGYDGLNELPWMFSSWREYRDYLLDKLVEPPDKRAAFLSKFASIDRQYRVEEPEVEKAFMFTCVRSILLNDYEGVFIANLMAANRGVWLRNRGKRADQFSTKPLTQTQEQPA